MASSTGNTITALPYDQRHTVLHYRDEDDTIGEVRYPINYEELYNLKGRVLTLVDAMFTDPVQRKAFKDLAWQTLQAWMKDIERAGHAESPEYMELEADASPMRPPATA